MTKRDPSLLGGLRDAARRLQVDLREMLHLRWKLARIELETDLRAARRLAILEALALLGALTGLPLLLVAAADALAGCWQVPRWAWLLGFGLALTLGGGGLAWIAWQRFQRGLVALRQSREELEEDLRWIREMLDGEAER
ncbi:MAG: phage holin family protein [Planctomycetota bacterium]